MVLYCKYAVPNDFSRARACRPRRFFCPKLFPTIVGCFGAGTPPDDRQGLKLFSTIVGFFGAGTPPDDPEGWGVRPTPLLSCGFCRRRLRFIDVHTDGCLYAPRRGAGRDQTG